MLDYDHVDALFDRSGLVYHRLEYTSDIIAQFEQFLGPGLVLDRSGVVANARMAGPMYEIMRRCNRRGISYEGKIDFVRMSRGRPPLAMAAGDIANHARAMRSDETLIAGEEGCEEILEAIIRNAEAQDAAPPDIRAGTRS